MKIAFITFEYTPHILGGAGTYISNLTPELVRLGHELHIIMPGFSGAGTELLQERLCVHRLPVINKTLLAAPSFWYSLRKHFPDLQKKTGGYDIVHINGPCDFSLCRSCVRCPRVLTIHHLVRFSIQSIGASFVDRIKNPGAEYGILGPYLEKLSIKRADYIIAVSQFTKQAILNCYHLPESKISVVPHGANPEDFSFSESEKIPLKKRLGIDSRPVLLFVGRLEPRKGIDILLKAAAEALKQINFKLIITGAGDRHKYERMSQSLGIADNVVFTGYLSDKDLRLLYSICTLFIFPSRMEGFGIAPLEAMAAGKPVLATKVGALPELIETERNGVLVSADDASQLAQEILKLLGDRERIKTMGENNLKKVRDIYTWPGAAHKMETIYKELLR